MATKAQQNDDGTVVDSETAKAQKGYANYEKDQQEAQKKLETRDAEMKQKFKSTIEKLKGAVGMKAGGKVSSASKRADGCAIRGKTRA
jgi:hypothetical protein